MASTERGVSIVSRRRRALLLSGAATLTGVLAARIGVAQTRFPTKPVRLIVGFPAGQATDFFARVIAQSLSTTWGQQVVVDNRAGGSGVPAVMLCKNAAPDGYTMAMGSTTTLASNVALYRNLPYDPLKDFAPVSNVAIAPLVLIVHPSFPARTLAQLVAEAKRAPGKYNFASAGPGTAQHLSAELFKARAGIDIRHVPYKGSAPAIVDVIGGQVPLMMDSVPSALPQIAAGKVRAIAVTTANRIPQLPDVPTIAESGYPGFEGTGFAGIIMPAATPPELIERVSADIQRALNDPKVRAQLIERGGIPAPSTPREFAAFVRVEIDKWSKVAKEANIEASD